MRTSLGRMTDRKEGKSATKQGMGGIRDFDFSGIVVAFRKFFVNVRRFFLKWVLEGGSMLIARLIISILT